MYRFLFKLVFFGKSKNNTHKTFHILKMKHILKKNHILKMKTWDDYDYDESDDEEFKKLSPLGIDPPVSSQ